MRLVEIPSKRLGSNPDEWPGQRLSNWDNGLKRNGDNEEGPNNGQGQGAQEVAEDALDGVMSAKPIYKRECPNAGAAGQENPNNGTEHDSREAPGPQKHTDIRPPLPDGCSYSQGSQQR